MRIVCIIILFVLAFRLQAADLSAPLMESEWSIKSYLMVGHPAMVQFISTLTHDQLAKTPAWQQGSEFPPLSPRKAEDLALAMLHKITGERRWMQPDISLRAFDVEQGSSGHRDIRWVYVLQFRLLGRMDFESGSLNIIVLMDGTVIEPKRVDEKRFIPESTNRPPNTDGANADCPSSFDQAMKFDYHFCIAALAARRRGSAFGR